MAIQVVIDSASDISAQEAEKLGVVMLPMVISFGEEDYLDGVDLTPVHFYEKLIESDVFPKTSLITPFRFEEVFQKLTENGDEVVVLTISSKLSGTYASAVQAAEGFAGKVHVIDSATASIGERLLCQYVLRLRRLGLRAEEIVEKANGVKSKIHVMAMLNTLEYLKRGGRISPAVAFAGGLLALKPVIAVEDGEVKLLGKARGSKNGNNLLTELVNQKGGIDFSMPYGVVWSGADKTLLEKYVQDSRALWQDAIDEIPSYILGAAIGTHIGPGGIGVAFFGK